METSTLTFDDVANEIIDNSINSIVFIDDQLSEPFQDDEHKELSKGVYESFRAENCSVDFIKFTDFDTWNDRSKYSLKNRDLLVLDWQLDKTPPHITSTLRIIAHAVKKPNLHFICIYTDTEPASFPEIIYKINCYFSPYKPSVASSEFQALKEFVESEGFSFEEVFNDYIRGRLVELMIRRDKTKEIFDSIKATLEETGSQDLSKKIWTFCGSRLKNANIPSILHYLCAIGMVFTQEVVSTFSDISAITIKNHVDSHYLIVNHTIILISNKKDVKPSDLYEKFKKAVISNSSNFLTLMSLELRNLFKESSSFIGKDIDDIDELAFFHHKENSVPPDAFYDFLKDLWKNQASSFLYDASKEPKIFQTLDQYKATNDIDNRMKAFLAKPSNFNNQLGRLNYYYNIMPERKPKDMIRFGDIFSILNQDGSATNEYLICITAHCDCLYTDKIGNLFYFTKGQKVGVEKALERGDTGFDSFICEKNDIMAVNWKNKPFTLYIAPDVNSIENEIQVTIGRDSRKIKYHSTLKENYAQRIANNAYTYPLHVGIFFAGTKPHE